MACMVGDGHVLPRLTPPSRKGFLSGPADVAAGDGSAKTLERDGLLPLGRQQRPGWRRRQSNNIAPPWRSCPCRSGSAPNARYCRFAVRAAWVTRRKAVADRFRRGLRHLVEQSRRPRRRPAWPARGSDRRPDNRDRPCDPCSGASRRVLRLDQLIGERAPVGQRGAGVGRQSENGDDAGRDRPASAPAAIAMGESLAAKATRSQPAIFLKASAGLAPKPSIAHATKTRRCLTRCFCGFARAASIGWSAGSACSGNSRPCPSSADTASA